MMERQENGRNLPHQTTFKINCAETQIISITNTTKKDATHEEYRNHRRKAVAFQRSNTNMEKKRKIIRNTMRKKQ